MYQYERSRLIRLNKEDAGILATLGREGEGEGAGGVTDQCVLKILL